MFCSDQAGLDNLSNGRPMIPPAVDEGRRWSTKGTSLSPIHTVTSSNAFALTVGAIVAG